MATNVFSRDRTAVDVELALGPAQPPDTTQIAEQAWAQTLESCANRMGLKGPEAVANEMRQGNKIVRMHCCRSLAEEMAASLRSSYQNIEAVYAPDCDACPQSFCLDKGATVTPLVHLIVWAQRKTPGLDSRAAALGNALATVCQDVIGVREVPSLLHVQVIDDSDMQNLFGARRRDLWTMRLQAYLLAMQEPVEEL